MDPTSISPLRQRMIEDMTRAGFEADPAQLHPSAASGFGGVPEVIAEMADGRRRAPGSAAPTESGLSIRTAPHHDRRALLLRVTMRRPISRPRSSHEGAAE